MNRILTDAEMRILQAVMDRIVPADDYPGAWEAGAGDYLLRQLEGDLAHLLPAYRAGLAALDAEAMLAHQAPFAEIPEAAQDALLAMVEHGFARTSWTVPPGYFFRRLVEHTMEGYYGDPGNGGNRNSISWQMIGFKVTE